MSVFAFWESGKETVPASEEEGGDWAMDEIEGHSRMGVKVVEEEEREMKRSLRWVFVVFLVYWFKFDKVCEK